MFLIVVIGISIALLLLSLWFLIGGRFSLLSDRHKPSVLKPLIIDRKARDAVLKQNFSPAKVPSNVDAIIIGSGIGGLTCGVLLARAGKRVLMLEQHDVAGGMCHTWEEHGFEFDVGVHYVGYLQDADHPMSLLVDTLLGNRMRWDAVPGVCDKVVLGEALKNHREYNCCGDGQMFSRLKKRFPDNADGIGRMETILRDAVRASDGLVIAKFIPLPLWKLAARTGVLNWLWNGPKFGAMTLAEAMDDCGLLDPDLRSTFSYLGGDAGVSADEFPVILWANLADMYNERCFYPTGGPSEIPFQMIPQIEAAGGRVLVRAKVERILFCNSGKACGYYKYVDRIGPSIAVIQVFVGFDGSPQELDLPTNNFWVVDEPEKMETDDPDYDLNIENFLSGCVPFFATSASAKDSSWNQRHPGKSELVMCIKVDYSLFERFKGKGKIRHREQDYDNLKNEIARNAWERMSSLLPQKAIDKVAFFDVGSPLTSDFYFNTLRGEIYGIKHSKERMDPIALAELRAVTDIPGLFLTGHDGFLAGITQAAFGGLICASRVLNRGLILEIGLLSLKRRLCRRIKRLLSLEE